MSRVTEKEFYAVVERLEEILGVELITNIWHKHFSVYTKGEGNSCQELIASSNTRRDCVDQMRAALNALRVLEKLNKGAKQ